MNGLSNQPRRCLWVAAAALAMLASRAIASDPFGEFSPDMRFVVVSWPVSGRTGGAAILDLSTGAVRPLTDGQGDVLGASWSPDGRRLVYAVGSETAPRTYILDLVTNRSRKLFLPILPPYAWREDGLRFAGCRTDDDGVMIVGFNVTEFGETLRARVPVQRIVGERMVWLKNTDDVAFLGRNGARTDVYTVEAGQSNRISSTGDVLALAAGPGDSLVWARTSKDVRYILLSLYQFDVNRRTIQRLPFPEAVPRVNPTPRTAPTRVERVSLAPSSQRLAVVARYAGGKPGASVLRLFSMDRQARNVQLIRTATVSSPGASEPLMVPVWSPGAAKLGVLHREPSEVVFALFEADGSGGRVVARTAIAP